MDGIEVDVAGGTTLVIVRGVAEDFRAHVRSRLAEYCYGATVVSEDAAFYSFEKTVGEFLARFDPKSRMTQLGMAGELIVHILMPLLHTELTPAAIYFNKEERSIKKGFDLTFLGNADSAVWYGEVKTGEVSEGSDADAKALALINTAIDSLSSMLSDADHLSRWDAALLDTYLTLEGGFAKTARQLFRSDSSTVREGGTISRRVVLAGAVMHALDHCTVTPQGLRGIDELVSGGEDFEDARVLVIQQNAAEALIDCLRGLANG